MRNRPVCFVRGSARVSRVGFGVAPKQSFPDARISMGGVAQKKFATARHRRQHASRVRSPDPAKKLCFLLAAFAVCVSLECPAQLPTPTPDEMAQSEPVVVSATRFDIPLDQSPASVSVIDSADLEQKQIDRVSDA